MTHAQENNFTPILLSRLPLKFPRVQEEGDEKMFGRESESERERAGLKKTAK